MGEAFRVCGYLKNNRVQGRHGLQVCFCTQRKKRKNVKKKFCHKRKNVLKFCLNRKKKSFVKKT